MHVDPYIWFILLDFSFTSAHVQNSTFSYCRLLSKFRTNYSFVHKTAFISFKSHCVNHVYHKNQCSVYIIFVFIHSFGMLFVIFPHLCHRCLSVCTRPLNLDHVWVFLDVYLQSRASWHVLLTSERLGLTGLRGNINSFAICEHVDLMEGLCKSLSTT